MANNLHFEYSLSVNEKQTQQNLATFIKKTFGTDKNAKLSVPIKLDISTNLTNVDLKSIQDQLDKQFKGKLNLHATVKIDSSNVARQAQAELDKISKSLSLKVGLEVDPSAMKLMLGTVDVIKTLNKEVTKVKDNLKDLGKKIEININGAQINNVYDGALRTAEKIQKVNAQTTEEINEQLAMTKEQLAHQKKLAEEKKKELDIEKEKQANNKKIEESNKNIRKQQQQLNKELKNVEAQIATEKKKADVLDKQAKSAKSTAKVQEDATKKIEKSTEKIAELEKQRADNQAFLQSKREEEKALLTNIELNKQEITLLRTKIKEMEKLGKVTTTVTKKVSGGTTTSNTPKKPTKSRTSKTVVQVDTPAVQATVQATNAVNELENAEKQVTATIEKQADTKAKAVEKEIKAQDKLVQHTQDSAKKIENATNRSYKAEDSKRKLRMPNGKDKIYNRIAGSEFASSLAGYRIHDISSAEEQNEYELVLLNTLIKSRNVLTDFNIELKEGVALTEEQVKLIEERIKLIQKEMVDTKEMAGAKDKANRQPFNDALKAFLKNPNDEELGSKLDFQAEKVSKIGAMYKYHAALLQEKNRLEGMLGVKIKENAEVEAKRLEMEAKRDERATGIKAKTAENQSNRALNKNIYKDVGDFLKEEVFGFDVDQLDTEYEAYYEELAEQADMLSKAIGEKFNFAKQGQVNYEELDRYFKTIAKKTEEWKEQMASASDEDRKKLQDNIEFAEEDVKYLKMLANSITTVNHLANVKSDFSGEYFDADNIEETTEAIQSFADPKLVSKVKAQAENFDLFIRKTQALNEQTHQVKGEVLAMLAYFDRLNKATDASDEDWEELANRLAKYREVLGITAEEVDEYVIAEKNRDKKAEETKSLIKASIKQGKEYVKQLQQQMSAMDKETEAWKERNKAINVFKQIIKDEALTKEQIDDHVLKLYNLSTLANKEKDSGNFKESNSGIKIIRQQAKAEEDVAVKYEKQANALYEILKLKKEGKKVSFDINKLIDSEGHKWQEIAEQQEKSYRKMKPHMIDFEFQNVDMHTKFANGDTSNIFDPTSYMKYDEDAIKTTEDMIKILSEFSAKAYLLAELQEKMKTHEPMQNSKANLDIANKTTKARIEEAQAIDAVTAKQKEQQKNEQIHQEWLKNQEIAKAKEPYLKASKEIIKRIKGSTKYKNNKDDEKFMKSVQQTFMYIDNLKHSEATLQQTVDAFENLKTYAHETFNMKNETIKKLVEPFVKIEEAVTQTTEDMKKVESGTKEVAKDAQVSNQATQEKVEADIKATQEIQEQAQAQNKLKENVEATAEATEKQVKAQKEMSAELRKQLTQIIPSEVLSSIPSEMLDKMFEGVVRAVDNGVKLTKTKFKDIIAVVDGLNQLDYSKALGERGRLVAEGRKKKDGVIYNRTDEYKAKKEAMDKQVEELEKPLLNILKMMEKELKGTATKVAKEVKKAEPKKDKVEQQVNKTKQEQNKLAQQQEAISSNIDKKQSNILQTAKDILLANKEGRQYILDINSLIDEQGRSWQDIAKNSEKAYKSVKDANILYTSFENMDMNRAYGNDAQSNGIFTPANYIDKDKYDKAKTDAERIALMSEYDGKFGILFSLEEAFKQLLEQENIQENIQEKVETSLYDQIQAIEKMTNAQQRFNAILELTGLNYDKILKNNVKFFKDSNEWQRDKNLQTLKMDKNYGLQIGDDKNPYSFLAYKSALPNDPNTVQGINAMGELYAIREVLTTFKEMSDKEKQKVQNEQKTIETKKQENQVVQQVNQAKKEEVQIINQANEKTSQLKAELDSLENELKNLSVGSLDEINKKIKEIQNDPNYKSDNETLRKTAIANLKAGGRPLTEQSIRQAMFKLIEGLKMDDIYNDGVNISGLKKEKLYGLKDAQKYLELDGELTKLAIEQHNIESTTNRKNELEQEIKTKKEQLALAEKEVETKKEQANVEKEVTKNKQEQATVQKQIVQSKQDELKVSETQAEVAKKETNTKKEETNNKQKQATVQKQIVQTKQDESNQAEVAKKETNTKKEESKNEQKQVTVQKQIVQSKQDELKVSETKAEVAKKEADAKKEELETVQQIQAVEQNTTSDIRKRLGEIDKLTGVERIEAMQAFGNEFKNPLNADTSYKHLQDRAYEILKRYMGSPEDVDKGIKERFDNVLEEKIIKGFEGLFDLSKFEGVYDSKYSKDILHKNKDYLYYKGSIDDFDFDMAEQDKRAKELKDVIKIIGSYEGLKTFLIFFSNSVKRALEQEGNAIKQSENIVESKTDAIKEQANIQDNLNEVKKEEVKIESEAIDNTQKLIDLENQRKRILANIKYTKEDMLSFDELDNLKEDLRLNKEKTRELRKQGETAKFLEKVKEDAEEGQSAKLANKRLQEIFKNQNKDYSKYGVTDVEKFIKEQKAIGVLSNEQVGMKQDIEAQRSLQDELSEYEKQLKNVEKQIEEINSKKQEELKITQDVAKVTEQMSDTLEEPLKNLKTLEEYQAQSGKASSGDETFETFDEAIARKHKFTDDAIGYLEGMLGRFYLEDGGIGTSYAGTGLTNELIDSLGAENLNKIIAQHMEMYHNEYGKVARMYKDLEYLARTLDGDVENNKEFKDLTLKVENLEEKIRQDAIALVNDALKSKENTWYNDEKYINIDDLRTTPEGKRYNVYMSNMDFSSEHKDYKESVLANKQKLQDTIKTKKATQEVVQEVKNENKETQNTNQSVNELIENKKEEEKIQTNIVENKKEEEEIQSNIIENKKEEVDAANQLVNVKQQELNATNKIAEAVQETKEEEEVLNKFVEKGNEDWYKTYQYLSRVVESSKEFAKANRLAKEEWEELKEEADMSETDDQWKEMVKRVYDFANELGVAFKTEKGLYDQRKQALKDINILTTSVEEVVAKSLTMESKDGESDRTYGSLEETLEYNKAKLESLGISEKQIEATNEEAKAENELAKAKNEAANATDKANKAKEKSNKAKEKSNKTSKVDKPKQNDTSLGEMISIPKSTNKRDYIDGTLSAIKKVIGSSTFKKYATKDTSLKDAINDLDKEAKVNKSSDVGIDYWEGLIKRLKEIGAKGHVQETTIDNMLIPYIGGEIPKSKANQAVKDKAASLGIASNEAVDNAKKVEKSTQETAKAENKIAENTKVIKVDSAEVAKNKQDEAEATKQVVDNKEKEVNASNKVVDNKEKEANASNKVVEANKKETEVIQDVKDNTTEIVQDKKDEQVVTTQIAKVEEEKADAISDIADTQKEIVVITEQTNEINQEEVQAMKDELNAKEKLGAEQKAQLQTLKNEIKEGEKKEKAINKSIEQENKMIGKMQEKIALAQDAEETAKRENEERLKQRAELEAHIKLLEQQADEKRQAIALLESEVEYTEDNSFQIKQLTKEYDNLQEKISETQAKVDELTDSYYEQQEQARKANNEASQQMIDEYMKRIEEEDEIRRKESAKYLPARSGEVGEYKGGGDDGNVPPSGGGNPPDGIDPDLNERIKLRQRELMLSLQQAVHNKELNDEQKMGVQILADQIIEIGQLTSSMKDLTWLSQNFRENLKEFKFSIKVDEDNKKELARIAEEERKDLVNMWAGLFDEIDANEKLKAEKQSLEELIALYKEKTLAQVDEYSAKNSNYVDSNRVSELRDMIQYMEQNISSAGEYEQVVRKIGNVFRELKFDTNQTKQWYNMEANAEKARQAQEKQAKAQEELNAKVAKHIQVKKEQARLYEKEIMSSKTMRNATEQERMAMETLIRTYEIKGNTIQEVNQSYAQMQRLVKDMRLNIINDHMGEQVSLLDKLKNGIKDYVRFTLDLDDIQGVMQNVTRAFQASFEHIKVLDEAYTNINQTMDISIEEFDTMAQKAYEVGDASGALGTDILEMMKIYANANETVESLNAKVAGTTAFQNVSGLSGTDATNALQTIINQFKLTTEEGYSAGDAITYVGDAITGVAYSLSKDEGDAMREIISAVEDAGSVIESSGGSLEWYAAVTGTLAETVNATGSEVGGAMRMITARTLQQKEAFDEMNDSGEETEEAMANAEKALTSLGISIRGSNGDLRSIEEVLGDVASKWQTLSDSDQQFVAEKLAGTNRRSYFMALMENYQRVMELQEKSMTSEGIMMEASEKHAESLAGKLNLLTNAQEKFYQSLMNSSTMKSWIDFGTDSLNMITKIVQAMEGKWIPAIVGVTGALITFKKVMSGLSWEQFLSNCLLAVAKMMGVAEGANIATVALQAFKAGLKGIVVGAVIAGIAYLIQSFDSLDERTAKATDALNNYISVMNDTEGHVQAVEMMDLKIKKINNQNTSLENQQQLIKEVNAELSRHGEAYGDIKSILDNENLSLEYRLELLDQEISKRREAAELAAREAFDDTDWGNDVYKAQGNVVTDATDRMKQGYDDVNFTGGDTVQFEKSWIEVTTEINKAYQEGVKQFNEIRKAYAQELISSEEYQQAYEDFIAFETSIAEQVASVEEYTGRTVEFATQNFADIHTEAVNTMTQSQQDYIKNLSELEQSQQLLDSMLNDGIQSSELTELLENDIFSDFRGDITKTSDVVDYLDNKVKNLQNSIDSFDASNVNDTSTGDFDTSGLSNTTQTVQQANKAYIEQLNIIEDIQAMLDSIDENGYTLEIATEAIDSGLLDDYIGSVEDGTAVQEHLNQKIYEAQEIANQAYYNMMKDDENFWATKMANSENWRDHEQKVQNDIIALTAQALGIQETDFANFINTKGGFRQVDYSNCNTMAQAENKLQSSLMSQVSGYVAQMTNDKAGYRQTDMSNIVQFLNTQGAKEAQTVQELMTLWAKFYDAKAKAIQAEIADYNRRTQELVNMETQLGEEAWLEDGALKHGLLNKIKEQSQLKLDNVAMTNYFAGLTAGFGGVGGGVGQSYVGGGGIGGGLGGGTPSTNKVGSGGSGSGRKPSGSGSSYKPSGSGGSGSGSGSEASEKEVEDMELEIDRYYTLNDAITDVENALSKLQAEREKITTKSAYKKSMQQEIDLINQQIKALQNLNKEQTKERNEIKNTLSKNGFKFDSTGDITNYASRLKALQNSANSKSGDKKESAIAQVENLVELIERYNELNDSAIPETNTEIIELQNSIAELNKELAENMKDIEALGDRYFNVARKIASVDNALAMNGLLQDSTEDEERRIELMREEQKLMKQKQQYLKEQKSVAQIEANELIKELKAKGVRFGNGGNIIRYDEMMKDLTIKANSLVGDAQDESVEDAQELLELIEKYVELTEGTIPELDQSWQEYANSIEEVNKEIEEMYHAHQETAVQTQKDIASAYEHYLTERYNKVKEALQEEQDLYNKAYDEENYQRQLKEQQRALDEIAQQIAIYSRDTSQAGKLKLQQLQEEYLEQQEAINDMIRENEKSLVDDRFAEEQEALDKELELLTSPEHLIQVVNDAIGSGLITIGDQVLSLNTVMSNWLNETGDGLYALGGELKTELIDNLQNAKDILGDMGLLKNGSISLASSQALLGSLSNTGALSSSVTFNAPLMTIEGNVDPTVMPELKSELAKLEQTILTKIAKSMK